MRFRLAFACLAVTAWGAGPSSPAPSRMIPPRIHPVTGAKLNAFDAGVELDLEAKRIYIDAKASLDTGILEFLLVQGAKKAYESALSTPAKPSQVMAAMLLLGMAPGDPLSITLLAGKDTLPMAALIRSRDTAVAKADAGLPMRWNLAASNYAETRTGKVPFAADAEGILISLVDRSEAVVELGGRLTNPYRNAYFGYAMARGAARPKPGAPVTLILAKEPK